MKNYLENLPEADSHWQQQAYQHQAQLTKPPKALGRLEEIAAFLASWQKRNDIHCEKPSLLLFAGNHGVSEEGISAFPAEVTAQMVANFEAGGAAVNQLCKQAGIDFHLHAFDLNKPTANILNAPAMTKAQMWTAFKTGYDLVPDCDLLCLGEMGIGNSTIAASLLFALYQGHARDWVGYGTAIDESTWYHKVDVVDRAVKFHDLNPDEGWGILQSLGGYEFAAMAGAVVGARHASIPVMLDGYISSAAIAPLFKMQPAILDHCLIAHRSRERGHQKLLSQFNKDPLLDLDLALGEGSGAALAVNIVKAAIAIHNDMASFQDAGVSTKAP